MKKLISSKCYTNKHNDTRLSQDGPKQLLLSNNWATRNDSANVASALRSECFLNTSRKCLPDTPFNHDGTNIKETGIFRKRCLGSNSCYCKETRMKSPFLLRRPNRCLTLEDDEDRFKRELNLKGRSSFYCFCRGSHTTGNYVDSLPVVWNRNEDEGKYLNKNLQITDQRKEYEKFRDNEYDKYLKDNDQYRTLTIMSTRTPNTTVESSENIREGLNLDDLNMFTKSSRNIDEIESEEYKDEEKTSVPSRRSVKHFTPKNKTYSLVANKCIGSSLDDVIENRQLETNQNNTSDKCICKYYKHNIVYETNADKLSHPSVVSNGVAGLNLNKSVNNSNEMEECYTSTDASMNINDLKKFRDQNYFETHELNEYDLDDSDVPEAVCQKNGSYIRNKSIDDFSKKSYFSNGVTSQKLKNIVKCYQLGLAPNTVISTDSLVKIKFKEKDIYNTHKFVGQYQKPHYMNTFALRQQKMTTYRH